MGTSCFMLDGSIIPTLLLFLSQRYCPANSCYRVHLNPKQPDPEPLQKGTSTESSDEEEDEEEEEEDQSEGAAGSEGEGEPAGGSEASDDMDDASDCSAGEHEACSGHYNPQSTAW